MTLWIGCTGIDRLNRLNRSCRLTAAHAGSRRLMPAHCRLKPARLARVDKHNSHSHHCHCNVLSSASFLNSFIGFAKGYFLELYILSATSQTKYFSRIIIFLVQFPVRIFFSNYNILPSGFTVRIFFSNYNILHQFRQQNIFLKL